jgi:2-oxoglutarate/2-oxoacid ferredoxin oxidoreductase subunit alpha
VLVVEMNDEGLYGFGQMAMLLRARYALPPLAASRRPTGSPSRIGEIVDGVNRSLGRNGNGQV